jgi:hypothetical protein
MRKKLLMLAALTCVAGGSALVAPANSQNGYPSCEGTTGTPCSGDGYRSCQNEGDDFLSVQVCIDGTWHISAN